MRSPTIMEQFTYLHFDVNRNRRRLSDKEASLIYKCEGSSSYALTFNQTVSKKLRVNGFNYAKIRIDNFTQETYVVFVKAADNDTLKVRFSHSSKDNYNAQILGKNVIKWLCEWYGIDTARDLKKIINIGDNLSRIESAIVFKLNNLIEDNNE